MERKGRRRRSDTLRDACFVRDAIARAQLHAEDKGVPLTLERIACCLQISRDKLRQVANGEGKESAEIVNTVRIAVDEAIASIVENSFVKGATATMPVFYLKNNAGYTEKGEPQVQQQIYFINENGIQE